MTSKNVGPKRTTKGLALDRQGLARLLEAGETVVLQTEWGDRPVRWGHSWQYATPAYWVSASQKWSQPTMCFRFGETLAEETAACILGGFGMPSAVGVAAFQVLRDAGLLACVSPAELIEARLRQPLDINGRRLRYRFPTQRAERVAAALRVLAMSDPPDGGKALRDWLLRLPGVGPKTASWITRNWTGSPDVAIIDIHIRRAGEEAGVFSPSWTVDRDYSRYEAHFLAWAQHGDVHPAVLDSFIWAEMATDHPAWSRRPR